MTVRSGTDGDARMTLQVLLVDDEPSDLKNFMRDFPPIFDEAGVEANLHPVGTFEAAFKLAADPSRRFDLILTDTFRGAHPNHDAAVIELVERYRGSRFCPIVVFSASSRPEGLAVGQFVLWSDKTESGGIERAIREMLATGIPQAARGLHDDLDRMAGSYLWDFLDKNWEKLRRAGHSETDTLIRIIRRRAALQLAEFTYTDTGPQALREVHGIEFFVYPPLHSDQYSLGQVIQSNTDAGDVRVILTPHCYLAIQAGQERPRADYVKTVRAVSIEKVLGQTKMTNAKELAPEQRNKKLRVFVTPPSGQDVGKPAGRYWYLPAFLEIPHLYCDFMQVNSLAYDDLKSQFKPLAVLSPPYAESLQACYVAFHAAVGIPNIKPSSVEGLLG
jgi:hypothetical protein